MASSSSALTTSSSASSKSTAHTSSSQQSSVGKRRRHNASPFYLYCLNFVEEYAKKGRRFRTDRQGIEAAALQWNAMPEDEQARWRERFRAERKNADDGSILRFRMRNGDRGDLNYDPAGLGDLKDLKLKAKKDVAALTMRWLWTYAENPKGFQNHRFFVVSARRNGNVWTSSLSAIAIVEFTLAHGITDQFHANFSNSAVAASTSAKYDAVRRVLNWPLKFGRSLGDAPTFFVPPGQLAAVFDALTYVDPSSTTSAPYASDPPISLAKDLATVEDLRLALCEYLRKSRNGQTRGDSVTAVSDCCLTTAHHCVGLILDEFAHTEI